jgi:hypothetical protein
MKTYKVKGEETERETSDLCFACPLFSRKRGICRFSKFEINKDVVKIMDAQGECWTKEEFFGVCPG